MSRKLGLRTLWPLCPGSRIYRYPRSPPRRRQAPGRIQSFSWLSFPARPSHDSPTRPSGAPRCASRSSSSPRSSASPTMSRPGCTRRHTLNRTSSELSDGKTCTTRERRLISLLARSCTLLVRRRFRCDGGKSRYAGAPCFASSSTLATLEQHPSSISPGGTWPRRWRRLWRGRPTRRCAPRDASAAGGRWRTSRSPPRRAPCPRTASARGRPWGRISPF